ncbi:Hypothetical protein I595_2273 [Croceitalea dokdonensis DOKDO 023]|uniref:DUF4369 domain-containing protein n=1 Tax=Croceitalea dokdonensis DOKDO 023 TaxID=1300341 RepID=A0A0P7AV87_9FLAO|nr:DUF4369 domain-containing protein [Croceitalea dokdonensis]KPM31778.1 Hypothetical protein I595_2273 [Croceitalea dokdonensis DOKDO 023]
MKKIAVLITVMLTITACKKDLSKSMIVKGDIAGLKKGTLYLQRVQDSTLVNIDSVQLRGDGNFEFIYDIDSPEIFYLFLDKADNNDVNDRITFFGEQGEISVATNWNTIDTEAKVSGSNSHDTYTQFNQMLSRFNMRELSLAQLTITDDTEAQQEKIDSVNQLLNKNLLRRYQYVLNFALTKPDSYVTPYVALTEAANANPKYLDSIYNALTPKVASSKYGKQLKKYLAELK